MNEFNQTQLQLLTAAERLFAEEGIDVVSTRRISAAADQRNTSALHYHFGGKEALLDAILEYRMEPINRRRLELLVDIERKGLGSDVRALVEVLVLPFAEQALESPAAGHYLSLMSQLYSRRRFDLLFPAGRARTESLRRTLERLEAALDIPGKAERELRLELMGITLVHAVAGWDAERREGGDLTPERLQHLARNLVDYLLGGLTASADRRWLLTSVEVM